MRIRVEARRNLVGGFGTISTGIRKLTDDELGELELATDEALGRVEPE
jgi:hypothetical protein